MTLKGVAEQTHSAHPSRHTQKYGSPGVWIQQGFENNWSERKNPTSITSACFLPLVTTQKVLSGPITPHLGWAQRWFFKEKMPFGIFELWQRKNRPLKNTHPKSITIFKRPVSKQKKKKKKTTQNGDTSELQLGLAVCDARVSSESHQTDNAAGFKGKPWPRVSATAFQSYTPSRAVRRKTCQM